jgi:hypothetical protein
MFSPHLSLSGGFDFYYPLIAIYVYIILNRQCCHPKMQARQKKQGPNKYGLGKKEENQPNY